MKIFLVSRFDNILKQSGTHSSTRLEEQDTNSKYKQRRCKVCANKTSFKFNKCSKPGRALVLCRQSCFERLHEERIYDVRSSQSQ